MSCKMFNIPYPNKYFAEFFDKKKNQTIRCDIGYEIAQKILASQEGQE